MSRDNLRDGRVKNWFYLENDLLDRDDLTIYEKTVYIVIARYVNSENKAFPSYETIAKKGSMAKVQAKRVVKSLIQKGLLKKEIRKNKNNKSYTSNLYTLLNPKTRDSDDKDEEDDSDDRDEEDDSNDGDNSNYKEVEEEADLSDDKTVSEVRMHESLSS